MTRIFGATMVVLAFCLVMTAAKPVEAELPPQVVTEHDSGRTVTLRVGQRLFVRLKENAGSTAYRWRVVRRPSKRILGVAKTNVIAPHGSRPGHRRFSFLARAAGTTGLRAELRSAFKAPDRPTAGRVRLRIKVR